MRAVLFILLIASCTSAAISNQTDDVLSGQFKQLEPGKMPVITVTNMGDRDIDDIMMGISLIDEEENVLFSTGYTDMVTGSVWLAAGESMEMTLYITEAALDRNPTGKQKLIDEPATVGVSFDIRTVTFNE